MGKFSKDKGARGERYFVRALGDSGIEARRVPLSGAMRDYPNDIVLPWLGGLAEAEVKLRADGFREIYKWLKPAKILFIKANRQEGLAVIRLSDLAALLKAANAVHLSQQPVMGWPRILANTKLEEAA